MATPNVKVDVTNYFQLERYYYTAAINDNIYYLNKDKESSKSYWNKVLEIDPFNAIAQEALKNIK